VIEKTACEAALFLYSTVHDICSLWIIGSANTDLNVLLRLCFVKRLVDNWIIVI